MNNKTIVSINTLLTGSTGTIMRQICERAEKTGFNTWTATSYRKKKLMTVQPGDHDIIIGNYISLYSHLLFGEYTGLKGCFSVFATLILLKKLIKIKPDIIHLHNLHDSYINIPILFTYIKRNRIRVIWTLHDCWALTGRCPYFGLLNCDKWEVGCFDCKYPPESYPKSKCDATRYMWKLKRSCFSGIDELTIITPSKWLADVVRKSYLKEYNCKVIYNGIDLDAFKPLNSDFRLRYGLTSKKIVLGVASGWEKRKGLEELISLSQSLGDTYQVILVGTNAKIDESLPSSIISIHHTESVTEMAQIYTAADVFVNPTHDEVFGLVNVESLACGTPVVTFDSGGCSEIINSSCGVVVAKDDLASMRNAIIDICQNHPYSASDCRNRALDFDQKHMVDRYIDLYR